MQAPVEQRPAARLGRAVRAHPFVVLAIAALAVAVAAVTLREQERQYPATAEVLVSPFDQYDRAVLGLALIRDSGDPARTMQTAAALLESRTAAQRTAEVLGSPWTTEGVLGAVEIQPLGESNVLGVTATASGPGEAMRLADRFTRTALELRRARLGRQIAARIEQLSTRQRRLPEADGTRAELAQDISALEGIRADGGDPTLSLAQRAATAAVTGTPQWLVLVLAGIAGLALGSLGALAAELRNRRLRDEEEVQRTYPLPVLARVPRLPRNLRGSAHVDHDALSPVAREAFRTLRAQLERRSSGSTSIMVTSPSVGDGKTTTAAGLSVALARAGYDVVAIDFDLRKPSLAATLGCRTGSGLSSLLTEGTRVEELLVTAPASPQLRVLGALERDSALVDALLRALPDIVAQARELAEYVVVDTAPLGEVSDALLVVGELDERFLVVRTGHTERRRLELARDLLERASARPSGLVVVGDALAVSSAYHEPTPAAVLAAGNGGGAARAVRH